MNATWSVNNPLLNRFWEPLNFQLTMGLTHRDEGKTKTVEIPISEN